MSCSTCKKSCQKNESLCPLCDQATHKVVADEVYGMLKASVEPYVHGAYFQLCDNEDCEVVFHSVDMEEIILTQDIDKLKIEEKSIDNERL